MSSKRHSSSVSYLHDAFLKMQQQIYYDNSDLRLRAELADFLAKGPEAQLKDLGEKMRLRDRGYFEGLCRKIGVRVYPKGIANGSNQSEDIPSNFITNVMYRDGGKVNRLAIFCEMPLQLHLIAVIWIMRYGYKLDLQLADNNYGNRLELPLGFIPPGRTLFKPYVRQYQKWWSDGLQVAKDHLDQKRDITIASFDLKDYYHRVELDFKEVEKEIFPKSTQPGQYFIHSIFKMIHRYYADAFRSIHHPATSSTTDISRYPLPIGLLSSSVLANWYLRGMDQFIHRKIKPLFYGRYVDDILIVLDKKSMTFVSNADIKRIKKYFKEHNAAISDGDINLLNAFISRNLGELIYPRPTSGEEGFSYALSLNGLENLHLQKEKIFIYQFDGQLSPGIVNKFVDDQKKRSSEFRFLSDEEDENFEDFEEYFFEDNLEVDELNKAKFKLIEENKFKLSVYLAKLIQRKIERGKEYKPAEEEKVSVFFKGVFLIKHYIFWEKLFTLYVTADRRDLFLELHKEILKVINELEYTGDGTIGSSVLKFDLRRHLQNAIEMALGLDPKFLSVKDRNLEKIDADPLFFRRAGLMRKRFVRQPLMHLTARGKSGRFSLIDQRIFVKGNWTMEQMMITSPGYAPHGIRFYEAVLYTFISRFYTKFGPVGVSLRDKSTDAFNSLSILEEAFLLFSQINYPERNANEMKDTKNAYFVSTDLDHTLDDRVKINEYRFSHAGHAKPAYRAALVNKYVDSNDFLASLKDQRAITSQETENFYRILDEVSEIKGLDFFVMPELALPHALLSKYVQYSARYGLGLITGIEHVQFNKAAFNFVLTCLPVTVNGRRDAVPIFRLKNHYSPEETKVIHKEGLSVAQPNPYRYSLFCWRGLYFSTYYCFELANIFHRVLFYSKADLLCAPVWNPDTYYYNNIVEAVTRDLHCYVIQVNTSQYGDTRVTRPTEQIRKDKAKIKGGTVDEYPFTLLVSDLDIETLREFQALDYDRQKEFNSETDPRKPAKRYKPTPPDFPKGNVRKRRNNQSFGQQ